MKEILSSPEMLDLLGASGKDCEHNPDLYYAFLNEVHWPLFLLFLQTSRGVDYNSLPILEEADLCIDGSLLTNFIKQTPRFHRFRSRYYFYTLPVADVTDIELFELSDNDVLDILNLSTGGKNEQSGVRGYFKRPFKSRGNSTL